MNILVVYKKSKYEIYRYVNDTQQYVNSDSEHARKMRQSHEVQKASIEKVYDVLEKMGVNFEAVYRADLRTIKNKDLVLSLGGDGTFLEVSHYLTDIPIMGVNTDSENSTGYFCCCDAESFERTINEFEKLPRQKVNRLEVQLDNVILEPALNDVFFGHPCPAAVSRYDLNSEKHKDSGVLMCTAIGSTAWMYQENGIVMSIDSFEIQYKVRGKRNALPEFAAELKLTSFTREGRIYIDGEHLNYECGLGSKLIIRNGMPLTIMGDVKSKRKEYLHN